MANTLTNLFPDIYGAIDVVSRELVGFIPRVGRDSTEERAAKDETIRWPVTPAQTAGDVTPSNIPPALPDSTIGNLTITLNKLRDTGFHYTGEEQKGLQNATTFTSIFQQQMEQSIRVLVNEIEADLASLFVNASRAFGIAGTTPFGTNKLGDAAELKKILDDNGAPKGDRHLVVDTAAGVNIRSLTQLTNVNEAGDPELLRRGMLGLPVFGFNMGESEGIKTQTAGTGASYLVNNGAGLVKGTTTVAVDTGTGTILAGDVVDFAVDTSLKYVVKTALSGGSFAINLPGIRGVTVPDNNAVTLAADYVANMAFSRNALRLATRVPQKPIGGDSADAEEVVTDPISGLSFLVSEYGGFHARQYRVSILYGFAIGKAEHLALLLG